MEFFHENWSNSGVKILVLQVSIALSAFLLKDVTFHDGTEFARRLSLSFEMLRRLLSGVEPDSCPHASWVMDDSVIS